MLEAFKLKPFDLEPVYASWPDAPVFYGNLPNDTGKNSKNAVKIKDIPVDEWLQKMKDGCTERNVPKEYWHKVAQHYMGEKAKARLDELKVVMTKVHGGNYRWNWEKFKIAMRNMGCKALDANETEPIKVQTRSSGLSWIIRHKKTDSSEPQCESPTEDIPTHFPPSSTEPAAGKGGGPFRMPTLDILDKFKSDTSSDKSTEASSVPTRNVPQRSASSFSLQWPIRRASKDDLTVSTTSKQESTPLVAPRPSPQKSISDSAVTTSQPSSLMVVPGQGAVADNGESELTITTITHAPVWLLNACNALDFLTTEHPKVMSTLSAILITAGAIPSIPAISAGAGGALLASGAVQAVGAIAVGVGTWLKSAQQEVQKNGATGADVERLTTI
ncbi:hypothetical protein BDP27DRAFT_1214494 [Rhodocollybia butyracea]|uniref:Uncharacterized protein n=1 Tax=Rhodocollybia butyracea TaxID=206335 RepID=A0A9P5UCS8_9AGAR|nr:hypothetical protein BDP27DRAFT_1214494 [Rhodocollybia butyracea]